MPLMSHLTLEQRYTISILFKQNFSQTAISVVIGKHKSVVSRELKRNSDLRNGDYKAELAQNKYLKRVKEIPKNIRFTEEIVNSMKSYLREKYSPEQIVEVLKKNNLPTVSHESMYQYIWKDKKKGGLLFENLRSNGKRYRKRGNYKDSRGILKDRVCISERPAEVEKKERFGDLEIDTIIGKDHKGAILTINDRATGRLWMKKLESKDAKQLAIEAIKLLMPWKDKIHTITADNGKEFACHKQISKELNVKVYFARPYHSWERGANENLNGLIRQYIPKKTDFTTISDEKIIEIQNKLNDRPRKRFKFESPNYMLNQKVAFAS